MIQVIPYPVQVETRSGVLKFARKTFSVGVSGAFAAEALYLARELFVRFNMPARMASGARGGIAVSFRQVESKALGKEGYRLDVSAAGIVIEAGQAAGAFYGVQTLLQLLQGGVPSGSIACLRIVDHPRFAWRGMMLDCSRHFFGKADLFTFLDMMAMHKLNVFHWHLTDDQGWRFEVKAYPRLLEVASVRRMTVTGDIHDRTPYGGFYTQRDCREIVAYAAARNITVVPEIEMPGHSQAVIAAYPELGCVREPVEVSCKWGVHKHVFNAGKEAVFTFLQTVLDEAMQVFPSEYIHIGGDECPKDEWKKDPLCQKRIRSEKLKDEDELQSYFIRRMERFVNSRGRKIIGWDEILEGGLAPNAAVMSWRGIQGGIEAARQGHNVVMTPRDWLYFDHYQMDAVRQQPIAIGGKTTVEQVYDYEPVPSELGARAGRHVMGVQANVWTEFIPDFQHVQYMTLPRAAALAEVAWSPREGRNLEAFKARLPMLFSAYDASSWTCCHG